MSKTERRKDQDVHTAAIQPCVRCRKKSGHATTCRNRLSGVKYHDDRDKVDVTLVDGHTEQYSQQYNVYEDRLLPTVNLNLPRISVKESRLPMVGLVGSSRKGRLTRHRNKREQQTECTTPTIPGYRTPIETLHVTGSKPKNVLEECRPATVLSANTTAAAQDKFGPTSYTGPNARIEFATPLQVQEHPLLNPMDWIKLANVPSDMNQRHSGRAKPLHISLQHPELNNVLTNKKLYVRRKLPHEASGGTLAASKTSTTTKSIPCLTCCRTSKSSKGLPDIRDTCRESNMTPRTVKSAEF